ncbi:MAG: hypothetical protein J0L78_02455 [Planctomycetes bacterium]|nr:hypothetical protein [Planctomycetota bacterium]
MEHFRVRPLTEADFDEIVKAVGGARAHPNADARDRPGADYLISEALVELKSLDDEGLAKPERQAKLATLFRLHQPDRPVIVLDRAALPEDAQRDYDRILEGPIKSAVSKASKQLKQSRAERPSTSSSVLLVINNGYTALDHQALLRMVAHRARQDTQEIDGVIVAGCYFYSDTFDSYFLWPIDYVPINVARPFKSYEAFRREWSAFAERFMTKVVCGEMPADTLKGPVIDTQFDIDGVTYVKPAPPMGKQSEFFAAGRPRKDSTGLKHCPTVARTFPDVTRHEWQRIVAHLPADQRRGNAYEEWMQERAACAAAADAIRPFVPITVGHDGWLTWCRTNAKTPSIRALAEYANSLFEQRIRAVFGAARERTRTGIVPSRYILVASEQIGQDKANDISHIAVLAEQPYGEPAIRELVRNERIFHEHALMLACAYAIREGIDSVLWQKHLEYAWA